MDSFLSNSFGKKPTTDSNTTPEHKSSTSDLFSSAKILAEAAKGGEQNKEKIADAAGDLLGAASQYGKLDETTTIGRSVHQAEEYLHSYNSTTTSPPPPSHSSTTTNISDAIPSTNIPDSTPTTNIADIPDSTPNTNIADPTPNTNTTHSNADSDDVGSQAESGYGGYMKMAEGLFKKN